MSKRKKKLAALGCMACLSLSILSCPVATMSVQAAVPENEAVMPMSDNIEWVYDIVEGKVYKRLFNYSTDNWIGDWIYVCELPGKAHGSHMGKN